MQVHTDFKFHPQVTQIGVYWGAEGHTELYLLEGERLAIIDTGVLDSPKGYIEPALAGMGRSLGDIEVIINTHGHHDHAGGNARVVAAGKAEVWVPEADVPIVEDIDLQFETYFRQNDVLVNRPDRLAASRARLDETAEPVKVDRALKPGEVLDLGKGITLHVVPVPGHTRGSSAYYWEKEGILFSGDAVLGTGSRIGGFPLIYSPTDYERTLDLVEGMDFATLCLGHHYRTLALTRESVKYGATAKQFVRESREIAHIIADGVASAVREQPDAPFLVMAHSALAKIRERLPLETDPETGLPVFGPTAALYGNWQLYGQGH